MEEGMSELRQRSMAFNSPLETGIRSVGILVAAFPACFDLQRLVAFDHLVVHTGDLGGPDSLHPEVPMRSAELLVRRGIVERGLLLMVSRGLVERHVTDKGFFYKAGEFAETFLDSLTSSYLTTLRSRAEWVVSRFGELDDAALRQTIHRVFDRWVGEFQTLKKSVAGEP